MNDLTLVNNEFLRQFEIHIDDNLARIEYSEQERKIFLTKISIPDCIQNLELMDDSVALAFGTEASEDSLQKPVDY